MEDRLGPDVPGRAVADAIGNGECIPGIRALAVYVIAEAQLRAAVVLRLDHEVGCIGVACKKIALHLPVRDDRPALAAQLAHLRQGLVRVACEQRARGPPRFVLVDCDREVGCEIVALRHGPLPHRGSKAHRDRIALHALARVRARSRWRIREVRLRDGAERFIRDRTAVIGEHDVAQCDADLEAGPLCDRDAERKRQRVGRIPGDFGDRERRIERRLLEQAPRRVAARFDVGQTHGPAARPIGVFFPERRGAHDFLEDQNVVRFQRRMLAAQARAGRAARQAASQVAPRVERQDVQVGVKLRRVRCFENGRA
jgi:hypothetical protein